MGCRRQHPQLTHSLRPPIPASHRRRPAEPLFRIYSSDAIRTARSAADAVVRYDLPTLFAIDIIGQLYDSVAQRGGPSWY